MTGSVANTVWARAFLDELARCGVRDVVVAPGSRSTPLVMACAADERFRARVHLDERSAAFFALGVGKATGSPAVVVTTSGTAVANCFPAVVEASQSGVPLLVLTADRPHRLRGADANQAIDQVGIFGRFVRAFHELAPPTLDGPALRHLRALACRAHAASIGPEAGPVHVNFPFDKPLEPEEPSSEAGGEEGSAREGRLDGAPFVAIHTARPVLPDAALDRLASSLTSGRGVIVAGPDERAEELGPAVHRLARATGMPVLADALSGARFGACGEAHVLAAYDLFLADPAVRDELAPDLVLRVGASPTSAALQNWLLHHDGARHVVIDDGGRWKDHGATASDYVRADAVDTLQRLAGRLAGGGRSGTADAWRARWRSAHEAATTALDGEADGDGEPHEGDIARAVVDALPAGGTLVVSSSMPVRDLDAFARPREDVLRVLANRGASGIDGVVSTAYGVSSRSATPTVCLIGDVAFFHDANGLLWSREPDAPVVFVVVDNDGGGIFQRLPIAGHEPAFTRFFATPHGVEPRFAAEAHGIDYDEVAVAYVGAAVEGRLDAGASAILRVRTDRLANLRRRTEVERAVARSVREALG
jgi:2-succinyl-5-enolpyruvyl-6-hydroxy-3-cyclohexene-1-carboxylate synthase